jgi:hypothetical protein
MSWRACRLVGDRRFSALVAHSLFQSILVESKERNMTKAIVLIVLPLLGQIKSLAGLPSQGKASPLRILNRALLLAAFTGIFFVLVVPAFAQTETATVSGRVMDPDGRMLPDVQIQLVNTETNVAVTTKTNAEGLYVIPNVRPGVYGLRVTKNGFKEIVKKDLVMHVQDNAKENFSLQVGPVSESVMVTADQTNINTTGGTVSTVVDRQFAENLPLNGRSFQSLIQLTPGVVLTGNNGVDQGQFSVNGQRANANYWTIDGVSANVGIGANGFGAGEGMAGALGATNALGGTNGLVSVDALQEFRIQTSTYAPEFGRQPGGQISIVTRSGTNQLHGSLFDYIRNDKLDANNWFADSAGLAKPMERQNDFGGTLGGPIWKDKTFFFSSYEGLRLRLPVTALNLVPDTNPLDPFSRQFALPGLLPYLNAYPLPNGPEVLDADGNHQGVAQFNASYSNPGSLDAYSLRIDHKISEKLNIFGRFNHSPSSFDFRGFTSALSTVTPTDINTTTATIGATWAITPTRMNDFRFNYSRVDGMSTFRMDNFGGATPLTAVPYPSPFTSQTGFLRFSVFSLGTGTGSDLVTGANTFNQQRQFNVVDSVTMQLRSHSLKFGVDYRRLHPLSASSADKNAPVYGFGVFFGDIPSAETGAAFFQSPQVTVPVTLLFHNLGAFAQDTWRMNPRLTMTYGLRWDVDFVPSSTNGPEFNAVTGFDLNNLSNLALLPPGTAPYRTRWGNVAPRVGLAYQLSKSDRWQTVLRSGFGKFYDLASSQAGYLYNPVNFPFGAFGLSFDSFSGTSLPAAPPIVAPSLSSGGTIFAVAPHLKSPYTLQWNIAIEQSLGKQQTITASYIGASGRNLLQSTSFFSPNAPAASLGVATATLVTNLGSSNYNALQLQYQRRLSHGLQVLASYSLSHSIDTASAGSLGSGSNALTGSSATDNRGSSDFDVRHAASAGITYGLPSLKGNAFSKAILSGWSLENMFQARSATPVNIFYSTFTQLSSGFLSQIRPDLVAGQTVYLFGAQFPGGKAFNPDAFTAPPLDPTTGLPTRQGDFPRNGLRGFGAVQWDFAVHRDFALTEKLKLQFRAEMFNVANHPNFGPPIGDLQSPAAVNPSFGLSMQTLGQSLGGGSLNLGAGGGAFNPLYQIGGPRSIQLALKLLF